jgi:hypothetical protein
MNEIDFLLDDYEAGLPKYKPEILAKFNEIIEKRDAVIKYDEIIKNSKTKSKIEDKDLLISALKNKIDEQSQIIIQLYTELQQLRK